MIPLHQGPCRMFFDKFEYFYENLNHLIATLYLSVTMETIQVSKPFKGNFSPCDKMYIRV